MSKKISLFLLVATAIFIFYPYHNFHVFLTQGDNGRDLYCFQKALEGQLPYRDYWWVYGPLMPYYYSFFYWLLGMNIQSILIGKLLLLISSGVFIYLILSLFTGTVMAVAGAFWFWAFNPDFIYTYNHIAGVLLTLAVLYFLGLYIKTRRHFYVYGALTSVFLLTLVKVNIGLSSLTAFLASFVAVEYSNRNVLRGKNRLFYTFSLVFFPLTIASIGFLLIFFHSAEFFDSSFSLTSYAPVKRVIWDALPMLWHAFLANVLSNMPNLCFGLLIVFSAIQTFIILTKKTAEKKRRQETFLIIIALVVFSIFNLHEFLASGLYYRIFWIVPVTMLLNFMLINTATQSLPRIIRLSAYASLLLIALLSISEKLRTIKSYKVPSQYLPMKAAKVYVSNSPEWIETVTSTLRYLDGNLKHNELFFALPYDPLYYFLADKSSPTRHLIFFEYTRIPPEEEKRIISDLEQKHVNWVIVSSRYNSPAVGLGTFGKTHCHLLAKYIADHFTVVATFGDWQTPPQEPWNQHGTKILKRINPL